MRAPRPRPEPHDGEAAKPTLHLELRHRRLAGRVIHAALRVDGGILCKANGLLDPPLLIFEFPTTNRNILFGDLAALKRLAKISRRALVLRHDRDAAGLAVEPIEQTRYFDPLFSHPRHERRLI